MPYLQTLPALAVGAAFPLEVDMPDRPIWLRRPRPPRIHPSARRARLTLGLLAAAALAAAALPASVTAHDGGDSRFMQTNLVSDLPGMAQMTDPNLINPWGMSYGPTTPIWVSENGNDTTELFRGLTPGMPFAKVPLTVSIPDGAPTGQVFNPTTDFVVSDGKGDSGPARFIFASENGSIDGWNPAVPPPATSTMAQNGVTTPNAVYKGLAISTGAAGDFLYAANFRTGRIDVFDGMFKPVMEPFWAFRDFSIPRGYAPFNVQNFGGWLVVTYAKQDAAKHDDVAGPGHGFVDVFDLQGHLVRRLVRRGHLNSPWGLAIAPMGFGRFGGDLLVGNFGDGRINAYSLRDGDFEGTLRGTNGRPIVIDGLWGLMFGNGTAGTPQTLFFAAGIDSENHGLFGTLTLAPDMHRH